MGTGFMEQPAEGGNHDGYISEWILHELLCKLPVKDVFRFKCVSKQWLSIILDPSFRRLYLSRQASNPRSPFVFFHAMVQPEIPNMFLTPAETPNFPEFRMLTLPGLREIYPKLKFIIRAADKGFLLLERVEKVEDEFISSCCFCNAITKQCFTLPAHNFPSRPTNWGLITQSRDGVLTSYIVLIVRDQCMNKILWELAVFSSETGEWADLKLYCKLASKISDCLGILNTTIFWMCESGKILSYHPHTNKLCFIDRPDGGDFIQYSARCDVYQECLKYIENIARGYGYEPLALRIWELQHNNQWRLQHTIMISDIIFPNNFPFRDKKFRQSRSHAYFRSFHPFNHDVVFLYWSERKKIVSYNMKTRRMESIDGYIPEFGGFFQVLPLWPVSIPPSLMFES